MSAMPSGARGEVMRAKSVARSTPAERSDLTAGVLDRKPGATARLITALENNREDGRAALRELYPFSGGAHIVGLTGAPGSGKSTLVAGLVRCLRNRGRTVAVVAVDPSSSLSGGAILGDRIRMQEHALDEGVFVRSMSTRGALGGLSRATVDAACVLDAAGFDYVIIETVGVGQAEIDIVRCAQTVAVVSVPGLGDDVQTLKAGLLEVADIHVVNKSDRPDVDKTLAELRMLLTLDGSPAATGWEIPLIATSALTGSGVEELADDIDRHAIWLRESGELTVREEAAAIARVGAIARDLVATRLGNPAENGAFAGLIREVVDRALDPHTAAQRLIVSGRNLTTATEERR
jgi:LAO/AO transport system kinase